LVRALSKQLGIPAVNLATGEPPPPNVIGKVPLRVAEDLHVLPLQLKDEGKTLMVAMTDPLNVHHLDTLRAVSRCRIAPVLGGRPASGGAQSRYYRGEAEDVGEAEEGFKVVDAQGRTVVKSRADVENEARAAPPPPPQPVTQPGAPVNPADQLKG